MAKGYKIKVLLPYFWCYLRNTDFIPEFKKIKKGIDQANEIIKEIALEENCFYFKDEEMYSPEYFVDIVHFSKVGMRKFAQGIAEYIKNNWAAME